MLPLVSDHAWKRWRKRFPGQSMIGALEHAKPVRLAHFIEQRPGFIITGHAKAIFIIKQKGTTSVVVTVIKRRKISQKMCNMIQAGQIP